MIFYIPLWITIIWILYSSFVVNRYFKKLISNSQENNFNVQKSNLKLQYFPIVLIFCWSFATIHRIYNIFSSKNTIDFYLEFFHVTFISLNGFFNALIYGINNKILQLIKSKFKSFRQKDPLSIENSVLETLNQE